MHLRRLPFQVQDAYTGKTRHWSLLAIADEDGSCQVEQFLMEQLAGGQINAATELLAFLDSMVYEEQGPLRWIGTPRCHESVSGEKIFEFKQGRLRVHWFYGEGRCVAILARAVLKSTQQTPKPLVKQLQALKSQYEATARAGLIEIK
jgi:hypothetical protein